MKNRKANKRNTGRPNISIINHGSGTISIGVITQVSESEYQERRKAMVEEAEKVMLKNAILRYVMRLTDLVDDKWKDRYDQLWPQILEIPEVKAQIYDKGKQAGTLFNRNLVGSIIGLLKEHEVYSNTNATKMAIALEGTEKHSIRQAIAIPVSKEISDAVQQLLDKQ